MRREWAPQVEMGCPLEIFLAMVCLMEECEVVRLEREMEDWGS